MTRGMTNDRDERGTASPGARLLAPIALVAVAVAVIMVVAGSLGSEDEGNRGGDRQGPRAADCTPSEPEAVRDGYYVVQPGDPGLSAVADKTCVPVRRLQRLNEDLDPQLIPQGACVNLRRDGCQALTEG
jgi:hypothetical protein